MLRRDMNNNKSKPCDFVYYFSFFSDFCSLVARVVAWHRGVEECKNLLTECQIICRFQLNTKWVPFQLNKLSWDYLKCIKVRTLTTRWEPFLFLESLSGVQMRVQMFGIFLGMFRFFVYSLAHILTPRQCRATRRHGHAERNERQSC